MNYNRSKRKFILAGIFFILVTITIGYAYITSKLNFTGTTKIKYNSWIIYFDNVVEKK